MKRFNACAMLAMLCVPLCALGQLKVLQTIDTGQGNTCYVASGDVNSDGRPDLVVGTGYGNSVSVRLGQADGSYGPAGTAIAGSSAVGVGDVAGNGKPLVLSAESFWSSKLRVCEVGPGGALSIVANLTGAAYTQYGMAVGDLNGDGKADVVMAQAFNLYVMLANGAGGFTTKTYAGSEMADICISDVNGDGKPDIVAASNYNVRLFINGGAGDFAGAAKVIPVAQFGGSKFVAASGTLIVTFAGDKLIAIKNGAVSFTIGSTGNVADGVALADLNGDGQPDIVRGVPSGVEVYLNKGNSGFGDSYTVPLSSPPSPTGGLHATTDKDGKPRILVNGGAGADGKAKVIVLGL